MISTFLFVCITASAWCILACLGSAPTPEDRAWERASRLYIGGVMTRNECRSHILDSDPRNDTTRRFVLR